MAAGLAHDSEAGSTSLDGRPLLSIVIPSRNRPQLVRMAIDSALANGPPRSEVVFSDNSDQEVQLPQHPRLRIIRSPRVLSMPDNWEQGLRAARGDWVMVISDKDRLVPKAIDQLLALAGNRYEVVNYFRATFQQNISPREDLSVDRLRSEPGFLDTLSSPVQCQHGDSRLALREWYSTVTYLSHLPMLYNALVKRQVIERALKSTPRFFVGTAPDVGSGLQIAANSNSFLHTTLTGTVLQIPTCEQANWSNGVSLMQSGQLGKNFVKEFGAWPLGTFPISSVSVIMQTLLDYQSCRPDVAGHLDLPWADYANQAAQEIDRSSQGARKLVLIWQLLSATQRTKVRPEAALRVLLRLAKARSAFVHRPLQSVLSTLLPGRFARNPGKPPAGRTISNHDNLESALASADHGNSIRSRATPTPCRSMDHESSSARVVGNL